MTPDGRKDGHGQNYIHSAEDNTVLLAYLDLFSAMTNIGKCWNSVGRESFGPHLNCIPLWKTLLALVMLRVVMSVCTWSPAIWPPGYKLLISLPVSFGLYFKIVFNWGS